MKCITRIGRVALCGLVGPALAGATWGQAQPAPPAAPVKPPGIQVQVPGVNIQVPGPRQGAGVNVQVPGVNIQAGTPAVTNNGYYSQTPWFNDPTIRQELNLNEQQYNQLNQGYQQAWTNYNKERNLIDSKLTPEQRLRREGELRAEFQRGFAPTLDSTFADPAARQRYNQLYWQYQGYDAFQDPTVQQQLNLTAEQQQQLNEYGAAWNQQYSTWRTDYPNNQERIGKQFREARREARQRIHNILTPAQRTTWTRISGQPYEFPSQVYFPAPVTTNTTLKPVIK